LFLKKELTLKPACILDVIDSYFLSTATWLGSGTVKSDE
jgi:hypothetical protein